jgi:hypothetical protein
MGNTTVTTATPTPEENPGVTAIADFSAMTERLSRVLRLATISTAATATGTLARITVTLGE